MSSAYVRYRPRPQSQGGYVRYPTAPVPPPAFTDIYSAQFNGTTSKINFGANFRPAKTDPWSLSFWFNSDAPTANAYTFIMGNHNTGSQKGIVVSIDKNGGNPVLEFGWVGSGLLLVAVAPILSSNTWYHVLISSTDGTSSGLKIYVDGTLRTNSVISNTLTAAQYDSNFQIGVPADGGSSFYPPFAGKVDEVAFAIGTAWGQPEATAIYNGGTPNDISGMPGLTDWYRMGDSPDTVSTFFDRVGSIDGTGTAMAIVADVP